MLHTSESSIVFHYIHLYVREERKNVRLKGVVCSEEKNDKKKQIKHRAIMKSAKVRRKCIRYRNEEKMALEKRRIR